MNEAHRSLRHEKTTLWCENKGTSGSDQTSCRVGMSPVR